MPAIRGSFLLVVIFLSSGALGQSALPTLGEAALPAPYNGAEIPLQNPAPQAQEPASPSRSKSADTTSQSLTKTVQAPAPTLKVATQLVQVSVVVQDKHGKPIAGLKKSDFTVLDDKQRQEIQFFSGEENSAEANSRNQPPLPPNTFTNKVLSTTAGLNNVTVILLDALNTPLLDQSYARDQVIKFLQQIKLSHICCGEHEEIQ